MASEDGRGGLVRPVVEKALLPAVVEAVLVVLFAAMTHWGVMRGGGSSSDPLPSSSAGAIAVGLLLCFSAAGGLIYDSLGSSRRSRLPHRAGLALIGVLVCGVLRTLALLLAATLLTRVIGISVRPGALLDLTRPASLVALALLIWGLCTLGLAIRETAATIQEMQAPRGTGPRSPLATAIRAVGVLVVLLCTGAAMVSMRREVGTEQLALAGAVGLLAALGLLALGVLALLQSRRAAPLQDPLAPAPR